MFWMDPSLYSVTLPTALYGQFANPLRFDVPRVIPQAGFQVPTMANVVDPSLLYGRLLHQGVANVPTIPFTAGIFGQPALGNLAQFCRPLC